MDAASLFARAAACAEALPGAGLEHPFGPNWDVFKVRGRVFLLLTVREGVAMATAKADPVEAEALRAAFPDIRPGYHMNKRHWISLTPGPSLSTALVDEIVTESYLSVVARLPRGTRPVDPAEYGRIAAARTARTREEERTPGVSAGGGGRGAARARR